MDRARSGRVTRPEEEAPLQVARPQHEGARPGGVVESQRRVETLLIEPVAAHEPGDGERAERVG